MGRRRFISDEYSESENGREFGESEGELLEHSSEESEEELDTHDEAFNKYSDFAETEESGQRKPPLPPRKRTRAIQSQRFASQWDQMLHNFNEFAEERNISKQQVSIIFYFFGGLVVYFLLSSMLSTGSRRYSTGYDSRFLECNTVTGEGSGVRELIECRTPAGYKMRIIESHVNSVLMEISEGVTEGSSFSLLGSLLSLVKYGFLAVAGVTVGGFAISSDSSKKWKLMKKKYMELSRAIQKTIENKVKGESPAVAKRRGRNRGIVSETEGEYDSEESEEELSSDSS